MQRLCLLLLAIFTLSTANAIKKVDLDIKTLKELVGSADRNKMGEILEKSRIMDMAVKCSRASMLMIKC